MAALGVAAAAWFNDPHDLSGTLPSQRADVPDDYAGVPVGGWHAYGRSSYGGRWSPLTQITPQNADRLQVAWTYHTGDIRGPDDPVETTSEVTPLKIDRITDVPPGTASRQFWPRGAVLRQAATRTHHQHPGGFSMSKNIPSNALVVVADGRKAILLRNEGSGGEVSLREERRLSPKDLLDDGPSGARPEEQSPRQTDEATFAKQLAEALYKMNQAGAFKDLVLAADPQTLGQLRDAMHKTVEASLVLTLHKDLTNHSVREITQALT